MHPHIIVNADDYGLAREFNRGIIQLARKNIITNTSVMIRRKFVNAQELKKLPNISIGLHLELEEKAAQKEIEKQVDIFLKLFKRPPSHLDGHRHCHLTEKNLPLVLSVAKRFNLPVRSRFPEDRKIIKKTVKTPSKFISWHPKRKQKLFRSLDQLQNSFTELVCHPGYFDKNCKYPYNRQREEEMKILESEEFQKRLRRFKKANYLSF